MLLIRINGNDSWDTHCRVLRSLLDYDVEIADPSRIAVVRIIDVHEARGLKVKNASGSGSSFWYTPEEVTQLCITVL